MGWLAPVGVPSPDGRSIAYNAWADLVSLDAEKSWSQQGIRPGDPIGAPSLRLLDLVTGEDSLLEEGAFSLAWRADGAVAFFKGEERDDHADWRYVGHVMVQRTVDGLPAPWTSSAARYVVVAWARDRLLVYRQSEGEWLDLLVLDGPGEIRMLAPGANLVALSPDGGRVLVSQGGLARVLEVATGRELAALDLERASVGGGAPVGQIAYGGSWVGDRVVAEGGPGIVVLQVGTTSIEVRGTLALPEQSFPMPPHEPRFIDPGGTRIVAWAPVPLQAGTGRGYVYLDCDLGPSTCVQGPVRDDEVFFQIYDPSRPAAGA